MSDLEDQIANKLNNNTKIVEVPIEKYQGSLNADVLSTDLDEKVLEDMQDGVEQYVEDYIRGSSFKIVNYTTRYKLRAVVTLRVVDTSILPDEINAKLDAMTPDELAEIDGTVIRHIMENHHD